MGRHLHRGADDQPHRQTFSLQVRQHSAGERTLVRQGQRRVAQRFGSRDQFLGLGGVLQKS